DLFLLQEIAERSTGDSGMRVLTVTFQHLAFEDYVRGATATQQREWGKVQGRFEDIPFLESSDQGVLFAARVLDNSNASAGLGKRVRTWAAAAADKCLDLGLSRYLPESSTLLRASYPLHPLTLIVLPQLAARFGQHGRTLFGFLSHQV